jgi:carbamoyltransferase
MSEIILGLHGYSADSPQQMHDAGVCILVDGEVVAAVDEERLTRHKRDGRFPMESLRCALRIAGLRSSDIDVVAFVDRRTPWQTVQVVRYALDALLRTGARPWPYLRFWARKMLHFRRVPPDEVRPRHTFFLEHHQCHAASAYYTSPWERATVVTLDGMGDFSIGGSVHLGSGGDLRLLTRSNGYFSPGHFYMIVTAYLGFVPGRHEGKVTGLAAHGDPMKAYSTMEQVIRYRPGKMDFVAGPVAQEFFQVIRTPPTRRSRSPARLATDTPEEEDTTEVVEVDMPYFRQLWRGFSREDIAAAAQKRFEDVITAYVLDAVRTTGVPEVTAAGGCFANVRLNQRLRELPEVRNLYIHPNMSDGGLSAGAALLAHRLLGARRSNKYQHRPWPHVYLGPAFTASEIDTALRSFELVAERPEDLPGRATEALLQGKVLAWFSGRMEYGPRALGHRSLIAAAVDPTLPQRINARLRRTEFMPFAPIILEEHASDWFPAWKPEHTAARFMTVTYDIHPALASRVPAIVHVDGTARPQVLRREDEPLLHQVLCRYRERTGIPLLINTSFNLHEEPIVCTPEDAIRTFLAGAADVLVMEGQWVERERP